MLLGEWRGGEGGGGCLFVLLFIYLLILLFDFRPPGTNVDRAKQLLAESGLPITAANDFEDVAAKTVAAIS